MFHSWNIKFFIFNYKLTYLSNYGLEINLKQPFYPKNVMSNTF
jgi:hypothetical protein